MSDSGWVCAICGCAVYKVSMYDPVRIPHNKVFHRHFGNQYKPSCGQQPVLILRSEFETLTNVRPIRQKLRQRPRINRRKLAE